MDASWDCAFRNWKCLTSVPLKNWVIIFLRADETLVSNLYNNIITSFECLGLVVTPQALFPMASNGIPDYLKALDTISKENYVKLVMIVIQNKE